jgi:ribonuclease PH
MARVDGRAGNELRPVTLTRGAMEYAEGSCRVEFGNTRVLISATVEDRVPPFLKNSGTGWVTAEYAMLPRSCKERTQRETRGAGGRTMEIQRLVGRSLRSIVDTSLLGERTILIDCDVLQADGGTRTACISGAYVALADAVQWLLDQRLIRKSPLEGQIAAVSVGILQGEELLDLCYEEDRQAQVDMNVVMTAQNKLVEIQGTAEGNPFDRSQLNRLLDLAQRGIQQIMGLQREALARPVGG